MNSRSSLFLTLFVFAGAAASPAATPLPSWYGDSNTTGETRQGYNFTTDSLNPIPEINENPYATPSAVVNPDPIFSDGWQDPAYAPVPSSGYPFPGDGAWDLGVAGTFSMLTKIADSAPAQNSFFRVDFLIYVAYLADSTFIVEPELDTLGLNTTIETDNDSLLGTASNRTYRGQTWTGYFDNVTSDQIGLVLRAPTVPSGTQPSSVLDTVEVFTRVTLIPEPAVWLLFVLSSAGLLCRRRRI